MIKALPPDILRVEIFPFLDLESRICLNHVVDNSDRFAIKLKKDAILQHEYSAALQTYLELKEDASFYIWNDAYKQSLLEKMYKTLQNPRVMRAYIALINKEIFVYNENYSCSKIFKFGYPAAYKEALKAQEIYTASKSLPHL